MKKLFAVREIKSDGFVVDFNEMGVQLSQYPIIYLPKAKALQMSAYLNLTSERFVKGTRYEVVEITIKSVEE